MERGESSEEKQRYWEKNWTTILFSIFNWGTDEPQEEMRSHQYREGEKGEDADFSKFGSRLCTVTCWFSALGELCALGIDIAPMKSVFPIFRFWFVIFYHTPASVFRALQSLLRRAFLFFESTLLHCSRCLLRRASSRSDIVIEIRERLDLQLKMGRGYNADRPLPFVV